MKHRPIKRYLKKYCNSCLQVGSWTSGIAIVQVNNYFEKNAILSEKSGIKFGSRSVGSSLEWKFRVQKVDLFM